MYGPEIFNEEIEWLHDDGLKPIVKCMLNSVPRYMFSIPASSTGHRHPKSHLGEGGLIMHIKETLQIAKKLFVIHTFKPCEEDAIIIALMLHDSFKQHIEGDKIYTRREVYGPVDYSNLQPSGKTNFWHPEYAAIFLKYMADIIPNNYAYTLKLASTAVKSHMGQWVKLEGSDRLRMAPVT